MAAMDPAAVLDRYDAEIRADPPVEVGVERAWADGVLRTTGAYNYIGWWDFPPAEAGAAVAREAAYFREKGVQWKVYSHDGPPGLTQALQRNGFEEEDLETFVVFDMAAGMPELAPPAGIEVRQVHDRAGVADLLTVAEAAFGRSEPSRLETFSARLTDPTQALFVAYDHGVPVSSGRIELAPGRAFAGFYGGGTVPGHQGRGVYRALVAARAIEARRRGHRYLTVDARETSRPILERLGFVALATIRDWTLPAAG